MNKVFRSLLSAGLVVAGLAGCGDDVTVTPPPPPPPPPTPVVHSVTVAPDGITVNPGQTVQMTAAVSADAGANPTVTWSTTDATRATVDATGLVTILATATTGSVGIKATATAVGGSSASGVATLNVVGTTVTGVTVSPSQAQLNAGTSLSAPGSLTATATVNGTNNPPQTVTWSSLDATLATVDQNGKVTANSNSLGGAVNVKACSTVDATKCGFLALTIIVPSPASVQIQGVTFNNGTANVPVVLTNVFGQIEIALNVEPGDRNITRVDALIGGQVVASQTFSSASRAQAAPQAAPTVVILSTNTRQLRKNGGIFAPVVTNGNSAITANLYVSGSSTPLASNAVPVVMNNPDAIVRRNSNEATRPASLVATNTTPSAVSTNDGNTYFTGTQTVDGFDYIAFGRTVPASVTLTSDLCGSSDNLVPGSASPTGIALSGLYQCSSVEGGNSVTDINLVTYPAGAVGPDGTPLTPPTNCSDFKAGSVKSTSAKKAAVKSIATVKSATATDITFCGFNSVASAFQLNSEDRWNMINPAVGPNPGPTFVDNKAPSVGLLLPVAFNAAFDQSWVNASFAFANVLTASDGGVGLAGGFPVAHQFDDGGTCTATVVTTGNDFPETTTSSNTAPNQADWGKRICTFAQDQLGNAASSGGSNYFGIDKVAPTVRVAGSTAATPALPANTFPADISTTPNTTIFSIAAPHVATEAWGVEALDSRSGFNQNTVGGFPAQESITILNPANNPAVTFNSQTSFTCGFTDPLSVVLSDNFVRSAHLSAAALLDCGLGAPMYVTVNLNATDRAGNAGTQITRNYAIDQYAPPTLASIGASTPLYTAGQPAQFFLFGSDDLEIIEADLGIGYPNIGLVTPALISITKPLSAIAGAARWDNTLTNILTATPVTDPFFIGRVDFTCTGAAAPYAGCAAADGITTTAAAYDNVNGTDDGQNPNTVGAIAYDVASQPSGAVLTSLLSAQTTDVAQQWSTANIVAWHVIHTTGATGPIQVEHKATTSIVAPFFDTVLIVRVNTAGNSLVVCGTADAPVLTDNGVNRFFTYNFNVPVPGPCATGGLYGAIGIKGAAALVTQLTAVP